MSRRKDRLVVSDIINEGRNVIIPGLDAPLHTLSFSLLTSAVCVDVCVFMFWTRHWLSSIPSSVSLKEPSHWAARLSPPNVTTVQLTPNSSANTPHTHNLLPRPCRMGNNLKKEKRRRTRQYRNTESSTQVCHKMTMTNKV